MMPIGPFRGISIYDAYIFSQYIGPLTIALGAFAIIGTVDIIFYLIELSVLSGIKLSVILQLIAYKIPALLVLFLPIAVLFSVMLTLVRMTKDNEILILRSTGITIGRIVWPLLILAALTSLAAFFTNETLVPWTNHRANDLISREIERKPPPEIAEDVVFKGTDNRYFYIQRIDRKTGDMQSVFVFEDTGTFPRLLIAKRAIWGIKEWGIFDGLMYEFDTDGNLLFTNRFDKMKIFVNQNMDLFYSNQKSPSEMDSSELKSHIQNATRSGLSTQNLRVEYSLKQSIPAACLVFAVMGAAFCFTFIHSGRDWWGVVIAIGVSAVAVMFYFFVLAVSRALGKGGTLSPFWAAWMANFVFGLLGTSIIGYQIRKR